MRIDEYILGLHFNLRKDILERWCNEYGYKTIDEFKRKADYGTVYAVYCNSYFQRGW